MFFFLSSKKISEINKINSSNRQNRNFLFFFKDPGYDPRFVYPSNKVDSIDIHISEYTRYEIVVK